MAKRKGLPRRFDPKNPERELDRVSPPPPSARDRRELKEERVARTEQEIFRIKEIDKDKRERRRMEEAQEGWSSHKSTPGSSKSRETIGTGKGAALGDEIYSKNELGRARQPQAKSKPYWKRREVVKEGGRVSEKGKDTLIDNVGGATDGLHEGNEPLEEFVEKDFAEFVGPEVEEAPETPEKEPQERSRRRAA